ncbi:MAG: polysaccharide biosynthesis tyrosine autokinase [Fuerstiella sp.]|nr:polysaccharide biosynthesis tyrosine autokinase [Fuerstiella sp.]MCP4786501.1 polysaccharide biosynthesis tyrosine autokinase [Fuerstiella sp.]MCP4857983.1 polysaccharide biosynthesis tyrosine autokinase [Fuerstiella sp.]
MDPYSIDQVEPTQRQGFHALMRFLRVVNQHKIILVGVVAAAAFLAVVRHKQTPRQYQSTAKLMIQQTSTDPKMVSKYAAQGLLSSYRQLLLSDTVLIQTLEEMSTMPPEIAGNQKKATWPNQLRLMLDVTFEPSEHVLTINCRSKSPEGALNVIESLTTTSEKYMKSYQQNISLMLMEQLENKRADIVLELKSKEEELLLRRRQCGDIAVGEGNGQSHPIVQRVNQLNADLISVRSRRLELESMLTTARSQVASGADLTAALQKLEVIVGSKAMSRIPGTGAANSEKLEELNSELTVMQSEFNDLRRNLGLGHPDIKRRQSKIETQQQLIATSRMDLDSQVSTGIRDQQVGRWLVNTVTAELVATQQYESTLQKDYDDSERIAIDLSDRLAFIDYSTRDVELLREQHTTLSNRLGSIKIEQGGGTFRIAPLSEPMLPRYAVFPVLSKTLVTFCVVALALGLGVIYVVDLLDDRLRSPEEVRDELGLSVLGIIRRLPEDEVNQARIYVHQFAQTPHAECFRTLKTSLTMAPADTKCIAITSSEASEGKTTTTVNLAASYAQTGQRTLLIDADMRRPGLSRLLEVRGNGGLSEILRAETDIPEMCRERVVTTEVSQLDVLPCGPRILNAGVLLSMPALADILDWAVSEYDQVIVDCPPTLPVSDAAIVGRYVDSILFLMNPDKTHRRSVARAVDQLKSMGLKIAGIVANTSLSEENNSYGYQYGYGYGYSSEYGYGHDDELDDDLDAIEGSYLTSGSDTSSEGNGLGKAA